jgi:hypothetical protein
VKFNQPVFRLLLAERQQVQLQMIQLIFLSFSLHSDKVRREVQLESADHD